MLKYPLVFIFNILEEQFHYFRFGLHEHFQLIFEQEDRKVFFTPIRNSNFSHIERRVEMIDKKLRKIGPAHVIALSVAGVDCRFASAYKSTPMKTLFTISSPHHGSCFADYMTSTDKKMNFIDPILKLVGLPYYGLAELQTEKLKSLNKIYPKSLVEVESTSSWRLNKDTSELMYPSSKILSGSDENAIYKWNDGLFYLNEMKWGNHLLSVDGDHSHVHGSDLKVNCAPAIRLAIDNAIRSERMEEGKVGIFK